MLMFFLLCSTPLKKIHNNAILEQTWTKKEPKPGKASASQTNFLAHTEREKHVNDCRWKLPGYKPTESKGKVNIQVLIFTEG